MLMDMQGRKLKTFHMQGEPSIALDGDALTPGIYILILAEEGVTLASLKLLVP
jgi:hypothetical protein